MCKREPESERELPLLRENAHAVPYSGPNAHQRVAKRNLFFQVAKYEFARQTLRQYFVLY